MVPDLLWRCPLCQERDALTHIERLFVRDDVHCKSCGAEWRMRRVIGDNFYLKLVHAGQTQNFQAGSELSITAWYDEMKKDFCLEKQEEADLLLAPDEVLYLKSQRVELRAEEHDPLFFTEEHPEILKIEKKEINSVVIGLGQLFLTNQRFIWQCAGARHEFPLTQVNSVYALMNAGLAMMVGMRLYMFQFLDESILKWVTHTALVAEEISKTSGHYISTSNF